MVGLWPRRILNDRERTAMTRSRLITAVSLYLSRRWEVICFVLVLVLLYLQVFMFVIDADAMPSLRGWFAAFAVYQGFSVNRLHYVVTPIFVALFSYLLVCRETPLWTRVCLDILGLLVIARMFAQLVGLNILVFDYITPRYLLIEQLLFFLPFSLLVWGWIYWRLDVLARGACRPLFRFDFEGDVPRPLDYFVASFSSLLSPGNSVIQGNSARARVLVLVHGLIIYNVMGLTLSRAVALVQGQ